MLDLIAKLEKAAGPGRDLDAAIFEAMAKMAEDMNYQARDAMSLAWKSPRPLAIRVHTGGFEIVDLWDTRSDGKVE